MSTLPTALVTGGRGGIARAIVAALSKTHKVQAPGREQLDIADPTSIEAWVRENGPPQLLVNAAGTIHPGTVREGDPKGWLQDIQVNLIGPYLLTHAVLRTGSATIINIASTAGYAAYKEWSAYCAAKAGLITLTKSLAAEGVNAFSISPGATDTQFRNRLGLPSNRLQSPEVIARLVLEILDGKYDSGVDLFVRMGEFHVR